MNQIDRVYKFEFGYYNAIRFYIVDYGLWHRIGLPAIRNIDGNVPYYNYFNGMRHKLNGNNDYHKKTYMVFGKIIGINIGKLVI